MDHFDNIDLVKGVGGHKYIKRTGYPGNYKYWYKMPDGTLSTHEAGSEGHRQAQKEHARRLILGWVHEVHSKSKDEMAKELGIPKRKFEQIISNLAAAARRRGRTGSRKEVLRQKEVDTEALQEAAGQAEQQSDQEAPGAQPSRSRPQRQEEPAQDREDAQVEHEGHTINLEYTGRGTGGGFEATIWKDGEFFSDVEGNGTKAEMTAAAKRQIAQMTEAQGEASDAEQTSSAEASPRRKKKAKKKKKKASSKQDEIKKLREQLKREHGLDLGGDEEPQAEAQEEPARPARKKKASKKKRTSRRRGTDNEISDAIQATLSRTGAQVNMMDIPRMGPRVREMMDDGKSLEDAARDTVKEFMRPSRSDLARVRAAKQAAEAENSPTSESAQALREADPVMDRAEQHVQETVEEQADGGNPYLSKAREVFERIQDDVKPERRELVGHALSAIEAVQREGTVTNEAFLAKYKELSGKNVRSIGPVSKEFEKGTFYTLEEALHNPPVNIEVERMKRGYPARQFARLKPFLKQSWLEGNPSAPPPYPTFGDIKTWNEHGQGRPDWAGTTRTAVPKEVYDASIKNAEGKPQYPPAWMPIHMMPAWNYTVKKVLDMGQNPYQVRAMNLTGQNLNLGNQARFQEGVLTAALRKYVQMRGGREQLVDIPASKLAESGLDHERIFKSEGGMKDLLKTKIFDLPSLVSMIDEAFDEVMGTTKKSWSLVVSSDAPIIKSQRDTRKSLIAKIKRLRDERRSQLS